MLTNQDLEKSKNKSGYNLEGKNSVKLCVFVCSSTGNGDMPENGEKFFRFLRRLGPSEPVHCSAVHFSVLAS